MYRHLKHVHVATIAQFPDRHRPSIKEMAIIQNKTVMYHTHGHHRRYHVVMVIINPQTIDPVQDPYRPKVLTEPGIYMRMLQAQGHHRQLFQRLDIVEVVNQKIMVNLNLLPHHQAALNQTIQV